MWRFVTTASGDIIDTLLAHHQQIKLLFGQVDNARGEHRRELFRELVALLAVHEGVEEGLVHPLAVRELEDGDQVVRARLAEEQGAKMTLAELYDLDFDDPRFDLRLVELRDAVTAHAEAEEATEFLRLREMTDPDRLRRMVTATRFLATMSPARRHPDTPRDASNLLLGPPLAVFDRVRDALREATETAPSEGTDQEAKAGL
jgi:hemerythrin superfamily protein